MQCQLKHPPNLYRGLTIARREMQAVWPVEWKRARHCCQEVFCTRALRASLPSVESLNVGRSKALPLNVCRYPMMNACMAEGAWPLDLIGCLLEGPEFRNALSLLSLPYLKGRFVRLPNHVLKRLILPPQHGFMSTGNRGRNTMDVCQRKLTCILCLFLSFL